MTPKDLRDFIEEVLDPTEIGDYIYPNDATGKAIAVGNPPNNIQVTGLEFIIPNFPDVTGSYRSSCQTASEERWHLEIIDHGNDKNNFWTVLNKLQRSTPRAMVINIPQSNPLTTLQRVRFTIIHSEGYKNLNYINNKL